MEHSFWHERWNEDRTAFHQADVDALLLLCFDKLSLNKGDRIFVPLCGKTLDLAWLSAQGCRLVGIELSRKAIEQAFVDMGIEPEISQQGKLTLFQSDGIDLFVGDVFDLTADALGQVDAIYDRAALVALPHEMRIDYAPHMAKITGSARQLLLTFVYDQAEMDGPPFAVDGDGVDALYGAWYRRKLGASKPITGSLAERCTGTESAWLLEPLGQSS
ncbi:MAG: thiopurine S-methyltransferase [Pseudomonadota bacterium]